MKSFPILVLPDDFDRGLGEELAIKGFCPFGKVRSATGEEYPVCFYTPTTLEQEVTRTPSHCVFEPGMIVVPDITRIIMEQAVTVAWEHGFFRHLRPTA